MNCLSLVEEAQRLVQKRGPFDQVWCVFDRDSFPADNFDNAIRSAESKGYRVAWSNEAFELWFLLHFDYLDTAIAREAYRQRLSDLKATWYAKNDAAFLEFLETSGDEAKAIRNAIRLLQNYEEAIPPSRQTPATKVHLLVQELRRIQQQRARLVEDEPDE